MQREPSPSPMPATPIELAPRKRRCTMGPIEVSQKRIDANRRNALRSTGPKTVEGK
jgi:hypothetical protein